MILLDRSKFYAIHHATQQRHFYVDFGQKKVRLSFCQLLALRHKINSFSIEAHFDGGLNPHGLEILTLCNNQHLFVLDTLQVLDLKGLVQNAFAALGLSQTVAVSA